MTIPAKVEAALDDLEERLGQSIEQVPRRMGRYWDENLGKNEKNLRMIREINAAKDQAYAGGLANTWNLQTLDRQVTKLMQFRI